MTGRCAFEHLAKTPLRRGFRLSAWLLTALVSRPVSAAGDWSAPLKKAQDRLAQGDYSRAYAEYLHHAEKNKNPLAQFNVALFHDFGWGRPKAPSIACRWYERAAEAKLPAAQHSLGDCLVQGLNGPPDPSRAANLYEDAARGGHWISYCSLAELYQRGTGVRKDPAKGIALCEQVASQGIAKAMRMTAFFYLDGESKTRDFAKGRMWLEQAAQRGDAEAQYRLGALARGEAKQPADFERVRHWFESAAAQGYRPAYLPTAELYFSAPREPETGNPMPEHLAKAYLWLSATLRRAPSPEEARQAADLLKQVEALMPETWKPALDEKVARHLAAFPPQ